MTAFQALLGQLGKLIAWDVEVSALSTSGKLNNELHPLSPSLARSRELTKKTQGSLGSFVNKLNKAFRRGK